MLYLISYDIEDDRCRTKTSHILEGFGTRIQKSVFECRLDELKFRKLVQLLEKRFQPQGRDNIRIYPLCSTCRRGALGMGELVESKGSSAYIFL